MGLRSRKLLWILAGAASIVLLLVLALSLRGRGLRQGLVWRIRAVQDASTVAASARGDYTSVVFLHHSTGRNLIEQGGVRERLTAAGFDFWDHDYNPRGLTRPDGTSSGYSYDIPGDNTDPDGLARVFSQPRFSLPLNAFSGLLQHQVIAFKSCFPVSHIARDAQLEQYRVYYLEMRDVMDQHQDHIFVVVTPPPLNPAATDAQAAARARAFADWLGSDGFLDGHANIFTFDLFDMLAENDPSAGDYNMLRAGYREGENSHPNELANQTIGPRFADFIVQAVQTVRERGGGQ